MENENKNKPENINNSNEKLLLSDVSIAKRKVCKPCNGTGGNAGYGIAYFKCVHCKGTGLQT